MYLLVGLGNPGFRYAMNRHNVGFMTLDSVRDHLSFPAPKEKFDGLYSEGRVLGDKAALLWPQTYMNESGRAVGAVARFYKIPTERIFVFYDDLDLAPGKVRVRQGGGTAGHNGLKSMNAHLPDEMYWRVRIGIGHPGDRDRVSGYVLSDFSKEEREGWLPERFEAMARHVELLLSGETERYMTKVMS